MFFQMDYHFLYDLISSDNFCNHNGFLLRTLVRFSEAHIFHATVKTSQIKWRNIYDRMDSAKARQFREIDVELGFIKRATKP